MPIKIPDQLPALEVLGNENIFVMSHNRADTQDIRPMEVAILNLMPNKIEAEIQILRMLSNTPLQINIELLRLHLNESKNTPQAHLDQFYRLFDDIKHKHYDGLIITGAPLGQIDYEQVLYWDKICEMFDWTLTNVTSTMFSCWAAHAALYHFYGINRTLREDKLSGVYQHNTLVTDEELTRGFDESFLVPHSRFGEIKPEVYAGISELSILAESEQAGAYLVASNDKKLVFVTGHPEYDARTLKDEYYRDVEANLAPSVPVNYFPGNNPELEPNNNWRSHGSLLFSNWLNYYVYQITPYILEQDSHDSNAGS
ncbi:homoserine O-acetyltransferase MetA [Thalassotalea mangrovi]|uniref:Homoserine O-succinyltransferase n=1 Tax=Thalassotalea mangrovi TaxID=2572245 RepID=A0A4U1B512_9GAMM|nr:homoserine O-succinyltransferase [Thalassotalea mangrovi]TKB44647.1 homoserine O-succinyltransferase [Thalassotalea mangrovi]